MRPGLRQTPPQGGELTSMEGIMKALRKFLREEEGVTAIEYGLIAALIAVFIIVAVGNAGTAVSDTFQAVADALTGA